MYTTMKKLIDAKYYKTQAESQDKLDVFFAMNKLTMDEYVELTQLAGEKYNPVEPPIEPTIPVEQ